MLLLSQSLRQSSVPKLGLWRHEPHDRDLPEQFPSPLGTELLHPGLRAPCPQSQLLQVSQISLVHLPASPGPVLPDKADLEEEILFVPLPGERVLPICLPTNKASLQKPTGLLPAFLLAQATAQGLTAAPQLLLSCSKEGRAPC